MHHNGRLFSHVDSFDHDFIWTNPICPFHCTVGHVSCLPYDNKYSRIIFLIQFCYCICSDVYSRSLFAIGYIKQTIRTQACCVNFTQADWRCIVPWSAYEALSCMLVSRKCLSGHLFPFLLILVVGRIQRLRDKVYSQRGFHSSILQYNSATIG